MLDHTGPTAASQPAMAILQLLRRAATALLMVTLVAALWGRSRTSFSSVRQQHADDVRDPKHR